MTGRIVPITRELLLGAIVEARDPWAAKLAEIPGYLDQMLGDGTTAEAMIDGGRVLAAAGIAPQWHGRAVAWMLRSPEMSPRDGKKLLLRSRTRLDEWNRDPRYRRIEMFVCIQDPFCDQFGHAMGMWREGDLLAWDPVGRPFRLFARVHVAGEH